MTIQNAMFSFIATRDHKIMQRVNHWRAPRWVRVWMIYATRGGDGWLWYAMGLIIVLFGGEHRYEALEAAALSSAAGVVMFLNLKRLFSRRRPSSIEPHCWATLLPPDQFSFPSGHTITAFAIATPIVHFYPTLAIGLIFCAGSIAVSRIMLGLHFLSDVAVGCALGVGLGYGAVAIVETLL